MKFYKYKNCSTCQKAAKFLDSRRVPYNRIPIVDNPPPLAELKQMLAFLKKEKGSIRNLFNTSGIQYRELKIAEQFQNGLSETEAIKILSANGKLIKRPFLINEKFGLVGFKIETWAKRFKT